MSSPPYTKEKSYYTKGRPPHSMSSPPYTKEKSYYTKGRSPHSMSRPPYTKDKQYKVNSKRQRKNHFDYSSPIENVVCNVSVRNVSSMN
jgi:hypothetical protein